MAFGKESDTRRTAGDEARSRERKLGSVAVGR
jgi:hypothetical protein